MRTISNDDPVRWRLVVPVKDARRAKSRLGTSFPTLRTELARAMALDTLEAADAALGAASLVVVTSDGPVATTARTWGADVRADPGRGLDAAVRHGLTGALPSAGPTGWAVLLGDLPALRPRDLLAALARCARYPAAVVPDASGDGTTLLTSTVRPPTPRFGPGSACRHAQDATLLPLRLPRLRQDVDVVEDLNRARALGVGRRTRGVLARAAAGGTAAYSAPMQASVHTFDLASRSGSVLLDNGRMLPFAEEVFAASGLRHVRVGQRVSVEVEPTDPEEPDAHLTRLWIVGIGRDEPIR